MNNLELYFKMIEIFDEAYCKLDSQEQLEVTKKLQQLRLSFTNN